MYDIVYIIDFILITTFIIGLFNYKKYSNTPAKYFLYFLGYGIATEILGLFFYDLFKSPNYIIYNVYSLISWIFYLVLFGYYFKNNNNRIIVRIFILVVGLVFAVNTIFFQDIFKGYQSFTWLFGGLFSIICFILFFIELLNSDAILKIKHLLIFWIAVGAFLFQLGFFPVFIAKSLINYSNGLTYGYILLLLNFISSTCFSLGFIWSKKNTDY